jgi:GAF domain-containing protein
MHKLASWLDSSADDIDSWLLQGLRAGCEYFAMPTGIVSRIEGGSYLIVAVYSAIGDIFSPGMVFELKNTYCDAVARSHKTVTYIHVGSLPSMVQHPVYTSLQLESYMGTPLYGNGGKVVGTLNFSSHEVRQWEFDDQEVQVIERMARKIAPHMPAQQAGGAG